MDDKEIAARMRNLRAAQSMISERPYGRSPKIRKSDYGVRSGTSTYRADKVATNSLTTRQMTVEEQIGRLVEARQVPKSERIRKNSYAIPTEKGRYLQ